MVMKRVFMAYIRWQIENAKFALEIWGRSARGDYWRERIADEQAKLEMYQALIHHVRYGTELRLMSPVERVWYRALYGACLLDEQGVPRGNGQRRAVWALHRAELKMLNLSERRAG